jgi:hypothetical protein
VLHASAQSATKSNAALRTRPGTAPATIAETQCAAAGGTSFVDQSPPPHVM